MLVKLIKLYYIIKIDILIEYLNNLSNKIINKEKC